MLSADRKSMLHLYCLQQIRARSDKSPRVCLLPQKQVTIKDFPWSPFQARPDPVGRSEYSGLDRLPQAFLQPQNGVSGTGELHKPRKVPPHCSHVFFPHRQGNSVELPCTVEVKCHCYHSPSTYVPVVACFEVSSRKK